MNTRDIHFMCVLPSPVGPGTDDFIMAGVETRQVKGSLVEDPEGLDLFSGLYTRKGSYVQLLEANGVTKAVPVDNDPVGGGGEAHNILTNSFYLGIQKKADEGVIGYVHLAPSCKFTCPARIIDRNLGKEDKVSSHARTRFRGWCVGIVAWASQSSPPGHQRQHPCSSNCYVGGAQWGHRQLRDSS